MYKRQVHGGPFANIAHGCNSVQATKLALKLSDITVSYTHLDVYKRQAKDFTQSLLNEKRLLITDTTMRDAQQSLMATRMRTKDLVGASDATNAFMENAFSVEAWGGATYDTAYRFLKESPWKRLKLLRQHMPNTCLLYTSR